MDVATCSSICVENNYTDTDSIAAATADSNIQQSDISQTNELTNGDILVVTSTPQMSQESEDHEGVDNNDWVRRYSDIEMRMYRAHSYDPNLFNVREVSPDKIAEQLTLIDLALLKSIRREEFKNCSWTKKDKQMTAPNIVAFSERFNHTSFLVVRDILNESNPKIRAETLVQFMKVAKRLHELNNIHSLIAVTLAIQSPPIHRLQLTWKNVNKKDKNSFDKLCEFTSENDNYCSLREHLELITRQHLPCVPHLGLHQRDLVYLDTVAKHSKTTDADRTKYLSEADKIIEFILKCQNSKYDDLMPHRTIQKYLNSVLYINELQKFFEDDNYKLSLQIEPPVPVTIPKPLRINDITSQPHPLRNSRSSENLLTPLKPEYTGPTEIATPPRHNMLSSRHSDSNILDSPRMPRISRINQISDDNAAKSRGGKVLTLPAGIQPPVSKNWRSVEPGRTTPHLELPSNDRKAKSYSPSVYNKRKGHTKSQSLGNNVLAVLGITKPQQNRSGSPDLSHNVSLLDDSYIEEHATFISTNIGGGGGGYTTPSSANDAFSPPLSLASTSSLENNSLNEESDIFYKEIEPDILPIDPLEIRILYDGILKRRVLKKNGKSVQFKLSHDFWVKLTDSCIILLPPKYKDSKTAVNSSNFKFIKLFGSRVKHNDPSLKLKDTQFIVVDSKGNHTKFTAGTASETHNWVTKIRDAIISEEDRLRRQEEETPLIKF